MSPPEELSGGPFDKQYRVGGCNFPGALLGNSIIGFYGPPRTFTVSAGVKF